MAQGPNDPGGAYENSSRWGVGLVAGGGMDYNFPFFGHHIGLRLFEADYRYTAFNFGPSNPDGHPLGGTAVLNGVELSSGLLWHIGSVVPPPPIQYTCAVTSPTGTIYPGDPVTITGTATNVLPKKVPTYSWTADNGATVSGNSNVASIDTKTLAPGTYTVKGHVGRRQEAWPACRLLDAVYGDPIPAADHHLLGESDHAQCRRSFYDYRYRYEPAESSSDLQLQLNGWFDQRQHLNGYPLDDGCCTRHNHHGDLQRG